MIHWVAAIVGAVSVQALVLTGKVAICPGGAYFEFQRGITSSGANHVFACLSYTNDWPPMAETAQISSLRQGYRGAADGAGALNPLREELP